MFNNQGQKQRGTVFSAQGPTRRSYSLVFLLAAVLIQAIITGFAAADSSGRVEGSDVYLPATMNGYFEGIDLGRNGISGRVLFKGNPAAAIPVDLRLWDGDIETVVASASTSNTGYYYFGNVDSLAPGDEYYVTYGPNRSDSKYVYFWYGPIIDRYTQGTNITGGTFDIADVPLLNPPSGEKLRLPITIEWQKRGLPGDTYRLVVIDLDQDIFWRTFSLGDTDTYILNSLAPGMLSNRQYAWYVEVYSEPDSFGESYLLNDIIFLPDGLQVESVTESASAFERGTARGGH